MATTQITNEQIKALRRQAQAAGDAVQVAVCERALAWRSVSVEGLSVHDDRRIQSMTAADARDACESALSTATS